MIKPAIVTPTDEVTTVARLFSTPLVVKGKTWLPVTQILVWWLIATLAKKRIPERTWLQSLGVGAHCMPVVLSSEWGHNLAHAAAAHWVGKPIDAIRIIWGMPLLVYFDINDQQVTPRQHIIRALGGPMFNLLLLLPCALIAKQFTKPGSFAREIASVAVATNTYLPIIGLLPIPGIDGGAILKWLLVEKGQTIPQTDMTIRKVNAVLGSGLAIASAVTLKKGRWLLSGVLSMFAVSALGVTLGLLKEQE